MTSTRSSPRPRAAASRPSSSAVGTDLGKQTPLRRLAITTGGTYRYIDVTAFSEVGVGLLACRPCSGRPWGEAVLTGQPAAKVGSSDGEVVERDDPVSEDLVGVSALAGNQDRVARTGVGQGGLDGALAVGLDADLSRTVKAAEEVVEDLVGDLGCAGYPA